MNVAQFPRSKSELFWLSVVLITAGSIYAFLFHAPQLTWDDDSNIFRNPYYLANMWLPFWKEPYFGLFVPVTSTVWGALFHLGDGAVWPFRVLNAVLHLTNILLVYVLLRGLARRWSLNGAAVMIGVVIFALHPLQVHAVAWISGGRDLLAASLALGSVAAYFRWRNYTGYALSTALFLMSMLAKPSTVVMPLVIVLLEWILESKVNRLVLLKMGVWSIFAGAVVWLTSLAQQDFLDSNFTFKDRALIVLDTYSFYLQKFVAPYPLSANYARTPEAALQDSTFFGSVLMAVAVLAGFVLLAWLRSRRYLIILIWFAILLPVSGVVPFGFQKISTVSDHYNYLAMTALCAVVVFILSRLNWNRLPRGLSHLLIVLMVGGLGWLSFERVQAWTSDEKFFTNMAEHAPDSYSTALGMSIVMCEDLRQFDEGIKWTEKALQARPLDILALANQAYCFLQAKNYFRVIELEYYLGKLDLDEMEHKQPTAYSSLLASIGTAYIEQQQYEDGFQFLCEAYRIKPTESNHAKNLNIAIKILRDKGIEPTCEQVEPEGEETGPDPIMDIWPQPETEMEEEKNAPEEPQLEELPTEEP